MTAVTQTAFANLMGWTKGYVTQLKQAGRLVMTESGQVDVEASQARIDATRDPNRDDSVARNAAARTQHHQPAKADVATVVADAEIADDGIVDFQTARAIKENYLARQAKVDYEERIGKLVDAEAVSLKQYELARQIRDSMMAIPSRIAEQLAAETDVNIVSRMLSDEIRQALESAAKLAGQMDDETSSPVTMPAMQQDQEAA
jgi:hypothetical protein